MLHQGGTQLFCKCLGQSGIHQFRVVRKNVHLNRLGVARVAAGIAQTTAEGECLGDVLADLAAKFPSLAETCIEGRRLRPDFTANLGGERFVSSPDTPLVEGDTVLLLSLDAGG